VGFITSYPNSGQYISVVALENKMLWLFYKGISIDLVEVGSLWNYNINTSTWNSVSRMVDNKNLLMMISGTKDNFLIIVERTVLTYDMVTPYYYYDNQANRLSPLEISFNI
jgi:hypothetical protein